MGNPYLYVFHVRFRDPENELGSPSDYMGVIGQWIIGPNGEKTHIESGALTPAKLDAAGYKLPDIIDAVNLALSKDLEAAKIEIFSVKNDNDALRADLSAQTKLAKDNALAAKQNADVATAIDQQRLAVIADAATQAEAASAKLAEAQAIIVQQAAEIDRLKAKP